MDKKKKIIRQYYFILVAVLIAYFLVFLALKYFNIFNIGENKLLFIFITFVYYIIVKNALSNYFKKKIFEIDPELKQKENDKVKQVKQVFFNSETKWYKNVNLIYILGMIVIILLFTIFSK
ncbi:hypothetical protein Y919_11910 [Caloranaerobacter azorensis H53214]|uniref:DUF3899 domain-containing protein n=1 Tax=Caloranaerobacter azorensis H53214 TaxID=1156417 RepID=A0A096BFE7_9FIRM|nr:hypothetical protein [Caloranaerobacter azorensis]KGG79463.1 hypothetical protein Y919_11910 [Caloranaerobacter azorensis H53214]